MICSTEKYFQKNKTIKKGFTLSEVLVVLGMLSVISVVVFSIFITFRKSQSLDLDVETIVETLNQARSQTLSSYNGSVYGVHFIYPKIILFTGNTYSANDSLNKEILLNASNVTLTTSLVGGGSDVIFNRLTGSTAQSGTIVLSAPSISKTKTINIYSTGLIETQ